MEPVNPRRRLSNASRAGKRAFPAQGEHSARTFHCHTPTHTPRLFLPKALPPFHLANSPPPYVLSGLRRVRSRLPPRFVFSTILSSHRKRGYARPSSPSPLLSFYLQVHSQETPSLGVASRGNHGFISYSSQPRSCSGREASCCSATCLRAIDLVPLAPTADEAGCT